MENFELGDIVYLKIGSPQMVIDDIRGNLCVCVWFDGNKSCRADFFMTSLTKENPNKPLSPVVG